LASLEPSLVRFENGGVASRIYREASNQSEAAVFSAAASVSCRTR
jgi:hypothetical protein